MHFSYSGFTHEGDCRCFLFRGVEGLTADANFRIEVELPLLAQSRVPVQDGPLFCLQLLTAASLAGPANLNRLHHYRVVAEDFRPLVVEREKAAAERALRATQRGSYRKAPSASNLRLTPRAGAY